jgi:hypothetical protein
VLPGNHFWGSIAGRAACCFQQLPILKRIAEAEVDDFNVLRLI